MKKNFVGKMAKIICQETGSSDDRCNCRYEDGCGPALEAAYKIMKMLAREGVPSGTPEPVTVPKS